jgi:hypothetical protein
MLAPEADAPLHHVARYLSVLGHPFIVIPASVAALAVLRGGEVRSALLVAGVFVAVSVAIVVGIRAGRFNDFDVSERERRPGYYALLTGGAVALALWLRQDVPAFRTCVIAAVVLATCGVLNRWLKVSLHTAFSLYAVALWGVWSPAAGLVALPIAASVAWSRVHLGRHVVAEVFTGAALGLAAGMAVVLSSIAPWS